MTHTNKTIQAMFLFLTACAPPNAVRQVPEPLAPISTGDRLRVTHSDQCCRSPSIGLEESFSADSLVLRAGTGTPRLAIARSNITHIERWNSGQTHMASRALLGFLAGAALGGEIGYQSGCGHCDGDWRVLSGIGGAMIGGGAGLIVGIIVGHHRQGFWSTIP
jgi:hypothetical protein